MSHFLILRYYEDAKIAINYIFLKNYNKILIPFEWKLVKTINIIFTVKWLFKKKIYHTFFNHVFPPFITLDIFHYFTKFSTLLKCFSSFFVQSIYASLESMFGLSTMFDWLVVSVKTSWILWTSFFAYFHNFYSIFNSDSLLLLKIMKSVAS